MPQSPNDISLYDEVVVPDLDTAKSTWRRSVALASSGLRDHR
jgi:hypothetical protein